ncbi:MAG: hypothetical protein ACRC5C_01370, partial [Bacilli bacterium]
MKKLSLLLLSLTLFLSACGGDTPTKVVEKYFSEVSKGTNADVSKLLGSADDQTDKDAPELSDTEKESLNLFAQSFKGKVVSETIKENVATVKAEVTTIPLGKVMQDTMADMLGAAFAGKEMSEDELNTKMLAKMKDTTPTTRTGTITLEKKDNAWQIVENDALGTLITGIDIEALNALSNDANEEAKEQTPPDYELKFGDNYEIRPIEDNADKEMF